jgi:enamine deaminase RidA (YjgF/YER057c/UK114 family)
MRRLLNEDPRAQQWGLAQGCETDSLVFVAGMAFDYENLCRLPEAVTVADETRICLQRIQRRLELCGLTLSDIAKTTVYLSDREHQREFMETYQEFWEEGDFPARCTFFVGIAADCRVEIDAIAVKPPTGS